MKKILLTLLFLSAAEIFAQWEPLPDISSYRESAQYAYLGGKLYLFGGYGGTNDKPYHDEAIMLDLNNISAGWRDVLTMPSIRAGGFAYAYNGKIYLLGGVSVSSLMPDDPYLYNRTVLVYDTAANIYTEKTAATSFSATSVYAGIGDKIFMIGGRTSDTVDKRANTITARVMMYDITQDKWTKLNDAPYPIEFGAVTSVDGKIFLAGGVSSKGFVYSAYMGEFVSDSIKWTKLPDMPDAVGYSAAGSLGGKFFVAGGLSPASQSVRNTLLIYDPIVGKWSNETMPFSDYHNPLMVNDGTSLYYISGNKKTTVYKFSPQISGVDDADNIGEIFSVSPNPAYSQTKISLQLEKESDVEISLFSSLGEKISTVFTAEKISGGREIYFDSGELCSGAYLYQIRINGKIFSKQMIISGR